MNFRKQVLDFRKQDFGKWGLQSPIQYLIQRLITRCVPTRRRHQRDGRHRRLFLWRYDTRPSRLIFRIWRLLQEAWLAPTRVASAFHISFPIRSGYTVGVLIAIVGAVFAWIGADHLAFSARCRGRRGGDVTKTGPALARKRIGGDIVGADGLIRCVAVIFIWIRALRRV